MRLHSSQSDERENSFQGSAAVPHHASCGKRDAYVASFPKSSAPGPGAVLLILACLGALLSILLFKRFDELVTPSSTPLEPSIAPVQAFTNNLAIAPHPAEGGFLFGILATASLCGLFAQWSRARARCRKLSLALQLQTRRADAAEQRLERLHELSALLSTILGNTQLVRADLIHGHPATQSLELVDQAVRQSATLVSELLANQQDAEPGAKARAGDPSTPQVLALR
jgi:hypothetical protein